MGSFHGTWHPYHPTRDRDERVLLVDHRDFNAPVQGRSADSSAAMVAANAMMLISQGELSLQPANTTGANLYMNAAIEVSARPSRDIYVRFSFLSSTSESRLEGSRVHGNGRLAILDELRPMTHWRGGGVGETPAVKISQFRIIISPRVRSFDLNSLILFLLPPFR